MVEIIFYACIVNDGIWWKLEDSSNSKKPVQITVPVHETSGKSEPIEDRIELFGYGYGILTPYRCIMTIWHRYMCRPVPVK
jgi:hypothetical protein